MSLIDDHECREFRPSRMRPDSSEREGAFDPAFAKRVRELSKSSDTSR